MDYAPQEVNRLSQLMVVASDIERISDYAENIAEYEGEYKARKASMSEVALQELRQLTEASLRSIDYSLQIFEAENFQTLPEAESLEQNVDDLQTDFINNHIERLMNDECDPVGGAAFFRQMEDILPELVILDIMLPDQDGYEIIRKLRKNPMTAKIPVIMVTARTTEMDLVKGFDSGADDYIRKPFSIMELLSRVRALLRRSSESSSKLLRVGDIRLDQEQYTVFSGEKQVELTFKEFELLRFLMINAKVVLSREAIMQAVWETDYEGETRTVDMHIKTLRQKLGPCGKQIGTVRNVGYVIS